MEMAEERQHSALQEGQPQWQALRHACPRCGAETVRVHRRLIDRLMSRDKPRRRYRCQALHCQWEGLLD